MSQRSLSYYFTLQSPWSYLGHADFMDVARRHDLRIAWRPISLATIFPASGGLPLAKRHPKRQAYRDIELQRWRMRRGLKLNLRPAFWPLDVGLADRTVVALAEASADPDAFVRAAFNGIWADNLDLADRAVVGRLLTQTGNDPTVMADADTSEIGAIYERNTREALDAGVFGAPTYILDDEPFWGQDRIPLLDEALASGRSAFTL